MKYLLFSLCIASLCLSCEQIGSKTVKDFPKQHKVYKTSDLPRAKTRSLNREGFEVERLQKDQAYADHTEKNAHQLTYDLFAPKNEQKDRAMIVLLHPGGFVRGSKEHDLIQNFAKDFAAKGYVTVAANYRLAQYSGGIGGFLEQLIVPGKLAKTNVYRSIQDAHTLLAFCQANAESWGVDTDRIYLAGYSAGAVLALNYVHMDEREAFDFFEHKPSDCLDCLPYIQETDEPASPVKIRGLVAIAGGIFDLGHIKSADKLPTLLIHGSQDDVVPFAEGSPFAKYQKEYKVDWEDLELNISKELSGAILNFLSLPLKGSQKIYEKRTKNVRFVELDNKGHEFSSSGPEYQFLFHEIEEFLKRVDG